ncbi:helix-turn-helix domain-containing protein [Streptosporangiaceae bacterium NEAU-GS5]|nr:helix-turn-helix domain-containing protein [Streptosporangiaceae bacterium NEAU-GS5]
MNDDEAVAALGDPVRRDLYRFVVGQGRPVGRGEAAEAVGVQRTLAAFHLDKLVDAGLLETGFQRLTERTGPGSGRPAKVYHRAKGEHQVSLPPRDYRLMAGLLADTVERLGGEETAEAVARDAGERARTDDPVGALERRGYEPYEDGGVVHLRNCPFHMLADEQPVLVCAMNLALCQGLAGPGYEVRLDPRPGECCVTLSKINEI